MAKCTVCDTDNARGAEICISCCCAFDPEPALGAGAGVGPAPAPPAPTPVVSVIYAPKYPDTEEEDKLVFTGSKALAKSVRGDEQFSTAGCKSLDCLAKGGRLYIVGHGNAGAGIGTHDANYGPKRLVKLLLDDKMPKQPEKPVTIWLYACGSGASIRRLYLFDRQEPFALRFGKALKTNLCSNYYIVGFAGFVNSISGRISQNYWKNDARSDGRQWEELKPGDRVIYRVSKVACEKISGAEWIQKASWDNTWMRYDIRRADEPETAEISGAIKVVKEITKKGGIYQSQDLERCRVAVKAAARKALNVSIGWFRGGKRHTHAMELGREIRRLCNGMPGTADAGAKAALLEIWSAYDAILKKYHALTGDLDWDGVLAVSRKRGIDAAKEVRHVPVLAPSAILSAKNQFCTTPIYYNGTIVKAAKTTAQFLSAQAELGQWLGRQPQFAADAIEIAVFMAKWFNFARYAAALGFEVRPRTGTQSPVTAELVTVGNNLYVFWVADECKLKYTGSTLRAGLAVDAQKCLKEDHHSVVFRMRLVENGVMKLVANEHVTELESPDCEARFIVWKESPVTAVPAAT